MKLRSVKYLTHEGIKNVWVNRLMSLASIGVLVACMVLIGLALLLSKNIDKALGNLEKQNVIMVYFNDRNSVVYGNAESLTGNTSSVADTSSATSSQGTDSADANGIKDSDYLIHNEAEARALCSKIASLSNVENVEYISSEAGLESIKQSMLDGQEEYFTFLDDEYGNPLSDGAKVTMKDISLFEQTIKDIEAIEGVDTVVSQGDLAEKINAISQGITTAGVWIIAILMLISLVIVSNTIRVTMYNRKLEISIMKAVGATDSFIRFPFVVEGVFIGLVSAVLSEGLVYVFYRIATETIKTTLGSSEIVSFGSAAFELLLVFVLIGVLAGTIGSVIMISKYLRKEGSEFAAI